MADAVAHQMGKSQNSHPFRNTTYHFNNKKGKKKVMLPSEHFAYGSLTFFYAKTIVIIDSKDSPDIKSGSRF